MKKYILLFSLFLYFLFYYIFSKNSTYYKRADTIQFVLDSSNIPRLKILFLGDSHISYAIKNDYLNSNHLSLSYPGTSIYNWMLYYDYLITINKKPDTLIIECGNHIFNTRRLSIQSLIGHNKYLFYSNYTYQHIPLFVKVKLLIFSLFPFLLDSTPLNIKTYINNFNQTFNKNNKTLDYIQDDDLWIKNKRLDSIRINTLYSSIDNRIVSDYIQFINYATSKGTYVMLFQSPLSNDLRRSQSKLIIKDYIRNIPLINFESYNLPDSFFLDIDHVRISKAKTITNYFYKELSNRER